MPAPKLDFEYFAAQHARDLDGPLAENICSPVDIVRLESLRRLSRIADDVGPGSPTDLFALAAGEPPQPYLSKVGGIPYRPAELPWPTEYGSRHSDCGLFLGQLYFGDSRDLVGETPGDVLLVFGNEGLYDEFFHFEWHNVGVDDLPSAERIAQKSAGRSFVPCFGVRYRTVDYRAPGILEEEECYERGNSLYAIAGLKVGGLPITRQHNNLRYLGSIGSVEPQSGIAYPWVYRAEPLTAGQIKELHCLGKCTYGTLSIFLRDDNELVTVYDFVD